MAITIFYGYMLSSLNENASLELQERRASRLDQCPNEIDRNHFAIQMQVSQ